MDFLSDEQIGNILKNSDEDNDEEFLMLETEETSDCEDNVSVHSDEEDVISGSDDDDVPLSQMRANLIIFIQLPYIRVELRIRRFQAIAYVSDAISATSGAEICLQEVVSGVFKRLVQSTLAEIF
ncbi:hypothetical protein EVAR_83110_1 [Eumeta japonica]|uniref:Uncharacterized protein n=1 Tax=Eumeta variegata TaxID=151549 RepID=A0A4C1WPJ0_EUMVA|nr:hypothetical protein EVAR_83110_1 [Eumeta japonica]